MDADAFAPEDPAAVARRRRAENRSWYCFLLFAAIVNVGYYAIGIAYYHHHEGWNWLDSMYFSAVTMSKVGYGDLYPSPEHRWFTVFFIFGGLAVFGIIGQAFLMILHPPLDVIERLLHRLFPPPLIDIDGDGTQDFEVPRHWSAYYTIALIVPVSIVVASQLGFAYAFKRTEGWEYGSALYHCLVTATTVGYGEIRIQTDDGKVVALVHIITSVVLLTTLIGEVSNAYSRRKVEQHRMRLVRSRLDPSLIVSLDKDGDGVDKFEFVFGMIVKLGLLEDKDIDPFIKQFEQLDTDGSGKLDTHDLARGADLVAAQAEEVASLDASLDVGSSTSPNPSPARRVWQRGTSYGTATFPQCEAPASAPSAGPVRGQFALRKAASSARSRGGGDRSSDKLEPAAPAVVHKPLRFPGSPGPSASAGDNGAGISPAKKREM